MEFVIGYLFFVAMVGVVGSDRTLGFWGAFLWALFLSPIIGLIITLFYETKDSYNRRLQVARDTKKQTEILQHMALQTKKTSQENLAEELGKWKKQKDDGIITEDEFQKIKNKIIAQFD